MPTKSSTFPVTGRIQKSFACGRQGNRRSEGFTSYHVQHGHSSQNILTLSCQQVNCIPLSFGHEFGHVVVCRGVRRAADPCTRAKELCMSWTARGPVGRVVWLDRLHSRRGCPGKSLRRFDFRKDVGAWGPLARHSELSKCADNLTQANRQILAVPPKL